MSLWEGLLIMAFGFPATGFVLGVGIEGAGQVFDHLAALRENRARRAAAAAFRENRARLAEPGTRDMVFPIAVTDGQLLAGVREALACGLHFAGMLFAAYLILAALLVIWSPLITRGW